MPGIQGRILEVHTPLVVDLDGTLLRSDMLFETAVAFIRGHPLKLFSLLLAAARQGVSQARSGAGYRHRRGITALQP